jgi:hypothetical protein
MPGSDSGARRTVAVLLSLLPVPRPRASCAVRLPALLPTWLPARLPACGGAPRMDGRRSAVKSS